MPVSLPQCGRGAIDAPPNRFEPITVEPDGDWLDHAGVQPVPTRYFVDTSRSIIATNDSPDVGFDASINVYRGCEHGCAYCYARPSHEYLGLNAGIDFESMIFVKPDAPRLLRAELSKRSWKPTRLAMSGVTDPYQPVERTLRLTRGCLEVIEAFRQPVSIVTKSHTVTRDIDLLLELGRFGAAQVDLSITTLDPHLSAIMEPRAAAPARRLDAIRQLAEAGVPVGVNVAPVVPGLTDHEIPAILEAASSAGARWAHMIVVRLPGAVRHVFEPWLRRHFSDRADKVLHRIMEMKGGQLNDPRFGHRFRGSGVFYEHVRQLFNLHRERLGLARTGPELLNDHFRVPGVPVQPGLFDRGVGGLSSAMLPGLGSRSIEFLSGPGIGLVQSHDAMERLMAFAGVTHEDLARCEFARRQLAIYVHVRSEMESLWLCDELERQWNPLGRRG